MKSTVLKCPRQQFQISTTSVLSIKPILPADDPGRSKAIGPFVNPPEDFIVARIGNSYKLIVNKFCVYRPMLVLHTTLFAPQTDDRNMSDVTAVWAILRNFRTPQMIIYNCGVEAGSSQGHKHLQLFPRQSSEEFRVWPEEWAAAEGSTLTSKAERWLGEFYVVVKLTF